MRTMHRLFVFSLFSILLALSPITFAQSTQKSQSQPEVNHMKLAHSYDDYYGGYYGDRWGSKVRCKRVGGFWSHGIWHPKRVICCKWSHGNKRCWTARRW